MGKKAVLAFSMFFLMAAVIFLSRTQNGKTSGANVADGKKIEKIKDNFVLTDMNFSLCFEEQKLPYDAASHTFFLPVDMESEIWEEGTLTGFFADAGEKKEIPAEIFFMQNFRECDKKECIAKGQGFSFIAVSKKSYGEYRLVFTGLPMITFHGTEYQADDEGLIYEMTVYDTDHKKDWTTTCYTKARLRGNTGLSYEKKSLRLNLQKLSGDGSFEKTNKELLGLRDDDDWILNALYADNSRIRDQLCVDLWNETGADSNPYGYSYGTDSAMTEVLINDGYQGIYDLMVPVDAKQLGLESVSKQYETESKVIERIYKKKYTGDWISADFKGEPPDAGMPDYRSGFYLKGDMILKNEDEWMPLYHLAKLMEADEEDFASEITVYNDQQNLIENWLFYQAIAGFDNQYKNYYYIVKNKNENEYGYFIPWDMNLSFGMVYADNKYYSEDLPEIVNQPVIWQPGQRMIELDVEGSKELLAKTWKKWRRGVFSDKAITERIQELEHKVKDSGAFARENERYPEGNQREDFFFLYDFAIKRMAFTDEYVEDLTQP